MINGNQKISVKLTRFAVGIAISLGIIISIGQLIVDINNQKKQSEASINMIVNAVSPLASKVAYELNTYSAKDVISGLFAYPIILSAEIQGDQNQVLARSTRVVEHNKLATLLNWSFSELASFELILTHKNYDKPVGKLNIKIDTAQISDQVIERFFTSLIFGVLRNIILAIILLFFFQRMLTRPIIKLSKDLENLELTSHKFQVIKNLKYHENDELGGLVDSINLHLKSNFEISQKLRQTQRMKSIGNLTGGIAHDFNNILGILMGNLELIERRASQDKEITSFVKEALCGVNRGVDITKKLLNYSRVDAGQEKIVSVNEFVSGMGDLISKTMAGSVDTSIHLGDELWPVRTNSGDLQDALLNLSLNARDAMPNGGQLIIETSNKYLDQDYARMNPEAEVGEYVMIAVSDTGTGMAYDIRDKALEPFFTTKQEGKGTGLGLSMVYGFVSRSGGSMRIYSELGEGTTIRIYLPKAHINENDIDIDENEEPLVIPHGNETILIVDDEKALLRVAELNLSSLGYKTITSSNAKDALTLLNGNKNIDLLFSDVIMPNGMDGYQLALAAHKAYPTLKILLTSGFSKKREEYVNGEKKYLNKLASNLVDKPYNKQELAKVIRNILDMEL